MFECVRDFGHFNLKFSNVSEILDTLISNCRMYQRFGTLQSQVFECIGDFGHFDLEFSNASQIFGHFDPNVCSLFVSRICVISVVGISCCGVLTALGWVLGCGMGRCQQESMMGGGSSRSKRTSLKKNGLSPG